MAIIRNIDVTAQSEVSFDDACRVAVTEAAKTLRGIMLFRVSESECVVEHDRIIAYRGTGKIAFQVERIIPSAIRCTFQFVMREREA